MVLSSRDGGNPPTILEISSQDDQVDQRLKRLILNMTKFKDKERITMLVVDEELKGIFKGIFSQLFHVPSVKCFECFKTQLKTQMKL